MSFRVVLGCKWRKQFQIINYWCTENPKRRVLSWGQMNLTHRNTKYERYGITHGNFHWIGSVNVLNSNSTPHQSSPDGHSVVAADKYTAWKTLLERIAFHLITLNILLSVYVFSLHPKQTWCTARQFCINSPCSAGKSDASPSCFLAQPSKRKKRCERVIKMVSGAPGIDEVSVG